MSPEQRTKLCERDAPAASTAGLEVQLGSCGLGLRVPGFGIFILMIFGRRFV